MDNPKVARLARQIYKQTFETLNDEPDIEMAEASRISKLIHNVVVKELNPIGRERRNQGMKSESKSTSFIDKLNSRLSAVKSIEEDIDTMIDVSGSLSAFRDKTELEKYLSEGSLLNVSTLASKALSIPSGGYMVWASDNSNTMLVPTKPLLAQEVFEGYADQYELFTPDLLNNWHTIGKIIAEDEDMPDFGESEEPESEPESEPEADGDDSDDGDFKSSIQMGTVDRTPIVRAMEQHGHTVTSLADAVGVDPPAISRILRTPEETEGDPGGRNPSIGLAAKIANELRADAEALFPDIFGTPNSDLQARDQPANRGSGMSQHTKGSTRKGKASKMWTQGNTGQ